MAVKVEAFRLSGRVEVDNRRAHAAMQQSERDARAVASSFKGLKGEVAGLSRIGGAGGFLPGLANISQVIQGIPQIGALAGALVRPLTDAAEAGVRFNAFLETNEVALKRHFQGSREAARGFIDEVRDFAGKSPFRTEGLIKSVVYGTATGFSPREALALIKDVGDAIASTGEISEETVQGVVRALSQMRSKGTVSAEEMEQLAERGIPAWEMLAHSIGKTVAETRKLSERGRLNGPAAVKALRAEMRARYGGMMDELQGTLTGRLSALEDTIQAAGGKATEGLTRSVSNTVGNALQRADLAGTMATQVNAVLTPVAGIVEKSLAALLGGSLTGAFTSAISAGREAVTGALGNLATDAARSAADGFKSTLGSLYEAGSSVAGAVEQGWRDLLDQNSPSRVLTDLGFQAGESLGDGFGNGAVGSLQRAQGRVSRQLDEVKAELRRKAEELLRDPKIQALLDVIGKGEGTFDPKTGERAYNKIFGGRRVPLGANHPGIHVPFRNTTSTAAGFGQFLERTWRGVSGQLGGLNFSDPHDQQLAMVELMRQRGMIGPLMRGDTRTAIRRGGREWASLPGSPYGQPTQSMQGALGVYNSRLGAYQGGLTVNSAPVTRANPVPVTVVTGGVTPEQLRNRDAAAYTGPLNSPDNPANRPLSYYEQQLSGAGAAASRMTEEVRQATRATEQTRASVTRMGDEVKKTTAAVEGEAAPAQGAAAALNQLPPAASATGLGLQTLEQSARGAAQAVGALAAGHAKDSVLGGKKKTRGLFSDTDRYATDKTDDEGNITEQADAAEEAAAGVSATFKDLKAMGKDAFGSLAEGVGSMVENYILLGETGPHAMRKLTAQVLASASKEATVKGIMSMADGFAHLFTNPAQSAADFTAAGIYFSVAAATGFAGRKMAGNLFNGKDGNPAHNAEGENERYAQESNPANNFTRRATGGPVYRSRAYLVGDGGRTEVFEPNVDGHIYPSVDAYDRSRRGNMWSRIRSRIDEQGGGGQQALAQTVDQLAAAVESLTARLESMSPGDVVRAGAARAKREIGHAAADSMHSDNSITEKFQRRVAA